MFNDPIAAERFASLAASEPFQTCFETGTFQGRGTLNLAAHRNIICTIEVNPDFRALAIENWKAAGFDPLSSFDLTDYNRASFRRGDTVIHSFLGSSAECLYRILKFSNWFKPPYLFYLDAHWGQYWPILDELRVIAAFGLSQSFIIIHDFKVPGKDFGFDQYGEQPLDYDYVKDGLAAINPNYRIFYNERVCEGPAGRGILYASPR